MMKRVLRAVVGVVVGVTALASVFGTGLSVADSVGQTYGQASEQIRSWGGTPQIASVVGDQRAIDDCVVTGQKKGLFVDSRGKKRYGEVFLYLDCNNALAEPGKPGNSLATPQGQKGKKMLAQAEQWNANFPAALAAGKVPWCGQAVKNADYCKNVCAQAGSCSGEVLDYLGSVA